MRKRLASAAARIRTARKLSLFSWRRREAFVGMGLMLAAAFLPTPAHALNIAFNSFTATNIPFEQGGTPNGTTVQFTIDTPGLVEIDIFKVQNFGDPGTQVAALTQNFSVSGSTGIFWNGQWLIDGQQGRMSGNYEFDLTLTTGTGGTPATATAGTLVTLNSVDIHRMTVTPSLDASNSPTFPYLISYALAKDANVSIGIYNSSNTLVRTLLTNKPQLSENTISSYTVTWDGLAADGTSAPIGIYTSSFSAVDPINGGTAIPRSVSFYLTSLAGAAVDAKTLFDNNTFVYPNPVRDGQATFQYLAARDGATVSLRIYTLTGTLVLDKNFGSVPRGVVQTFTWHADNSSGNKVGRGLYYYVMRESDPQGVIEITKKLAVIK